jgi:hypothetical protein
LVEQSEWLKFFVVSVVAETAEDEGYEQLLLGSSSPVGHWRGSLPSRQSFEPFYCRRTKPSSAQEGRLYERNSPKTHFVRHDAAVVLALFLFEHPGDTDLAERSVFASGVEVTKAHELMRHERNEHALDEFGLGSETQSCGSSIDSFVALRYCRKSAIYAALKTGRDEPRSRRLRQHA